MSTAPCAAPFFYSRPETISIFGICFFRFRVPNDLSITFRSAHCGEKKYAAISELWVQA